MVALGVGGNGGLVALGSGGSVLSGLCQLLIVPMGLTEALKWQLTCGLTGEDGTPAGGGRGAMGGGGGCGTVGTALCPP